MIKNMYSRIHKKLGDNAILRDNDRLLCLEIWREEGLILTPEQQRKYLSVSSPETIRRTRQKVQEDGYFRPSERVQTIRKELEYQVKSEVMNDRLVQSEMFSGRKFPA